MGLFVADFDTIDNINIMNENKDDLVDEHMLAFGELLFFPCPL